MGIGEGDSFLTDKSKPGQCPESSPHSPKMKTHLSTFLACCILAAASAVAAVAKAKPNVIILLTDNQGFGELGATGHPPGRTPHMDRFAAQGTSLTNFHVMPVGPPTRACLSRSP